MSPYRLIAGQILRELGPESGAKLRLGPNPAVLLGARMIEIDSAGIYYGRSRNLHAHGIFKHSEVDRAVAFLKDPTVPPPSLTEVAEWIREDLIAKGLEADAVSISYEEDDTATVFANQKEVKLGYSGPGTINVDGRLCEKKEVSRFVL